MSEAERAIREALPFATPGRWEHVFSNGGREHYVYAPDAHYRRDLPGPVKVAWLPPSPGSNRDANDAAYIAACDPENIAALLAEIDRLTAENEALREALTFYAKREHFILCDDSAWDTVSGEPPNYWCDEAGTATVEDGSLARLVLAGVVVDFDGDAQTGER